MSTIKTDRVDFEKLLNGIDPIVKTEVQTASGQPVPQVTGGQQNVVSGVVDNASANEVMNEKLFEFDYDSVRKAQRKKARKTVLGIVSHVIPEELLEEEYIQDKIEQDIDSLLGLYMQVETNTIMQRSLMDTVSRGVAMPRMYEVFGQMTDKIQSINKQIIDTEQRIRKTYQDLKYEIRDMQSEISFQKGSDAAKGIGDMQSQQAGMIISNPKALIESARNSKRKDFLAAKETKFTEVE